MPTQNANVIGDRIRYTRLERGMTQKTVAASCGLSVPTISRCEADGDYALRRGYLPRIAAAIHVDPSYLTETPADPAGPAVYELTMQNIYGALTPDLHAFIQLPRHLTDDEVARLRATLRDYKSKLHLERHPNWDERDAVREAVDSFFEGTATTWTFVVDPVAARIKF